MDGESPRAPTEIRVIEIMAGKRENACFECAREVPTTTSNKESTKPTTQNTYRDTAPNNTKSFVLLSCLMLIYPQFLPSDVNRVFRSCNGDGDGERE